MERTINIPEIFSQRAPLKKAITKLLGLTSIDMIFLHVGDDETAPSLLTILLNNDAKCQMGDLIPHADQLFKGHDRLRYRIYTTGHAEEELQKGNLYFVRGCLLGSPIYAPTTPNKLFDKIPIVIEWLLEKGGQYIKNEMAKARAFKDGADFYINNFQYPQAAFMLHQTIELSFRTVEWFMMGKSRACHYIRSHQNYIKGFVPQLGKLFNNGTGGEQELLEILDNAYMGVRYNNEYPITKEQLDLIAEKAEGMLKKTSQLFENSLQQCGQENHKGLGAIESSKENIAKLERKKLKEIQELTKEHFKMLELHSFRKEKFQANFFLLGWLYRPVLYHQIIDECLPIGIGSRYNVYVPFDKKP